MNAVHNIRTSDITGDNLRARLYQWGIAIAIFLVNEYDEEQYLTFFSYGSPLAEKLVEKHNIDLASIPDHPDYLTKSKMTKSDLMAWRRNVREEKPDIYPANYGREDEVKLTLVKLVDKSWALVTDKPIEYEDRGRMVVDDYNKVHTLRENSFWRGKLMLAVSNPDYKKGWLDEDSYKLATLKYTPEVWSKLLLGGIERIECRVSMEANNVMKVTELIVPELMEKDPIIPKAKASNKAIVQHNKTGVLYMMKKTDERYGGDYKHVADGSHSVKTGLFTTVDGDTYEVTCIDESEVIIINEKIR